MAVSEEKRRELMKKICGKLGDDFEQINCEELLKEIEDCDCANNYIKTLEKTIQFYQKYNAPVSDDTHKRLMDALGLDDE